MFKGKDRNQERKLDKVTQETENNGKNRKIKWIQIGIKGYMNRLLSKGKKKRKD